MGVFAPGSAHARPSAQPPINTSRNFLAHMSAESPSNISPNPSEVISKGQLLKITPLTPQKLSWGSETSDMTSEGLGEMFEGDSADMCAVKFPLVSMGALAEGLMCADPGARTPIGASGIGIIPLPTLAAVT